MANREVIHKKTVWCLLKVDPEHCTEVGAAFQECLMTQEIADALVTLPEVRSAAAQKQKEKFIKLGMYDENADDQSFLNSWIFSAAGTRLIFSSGVEAFIERIEPLGAWQQEAFLTLSINERLSSVTMLYAALGHDRFMRLPGCFGNLFIHPDRALATLKEVHNILRSLNLEEATERACNAGLHDLTGRFAVKQFLFILPLALEQVLLHDCGLLAFSYPDMAQFPHPKTGGEYTGNRLRIPSHPLFY